MDRRFLKIIIFAGVALAAIMVIFSFNIFDLAREKDAPAENRDAQKTLVFDVVRVAADGSVVMAGRSAPFVDVHVLVRLPEGERVLGAVRASGRGEWVLVMDKALPLGQQAYLRLRVLGADGKDILSDQIVTIGVPKQSGEKPLVVLVDPHQASRVLQSRGVASAGGELLLEAIDYDQNGRVIFTGKSIANHKVRLYLDNRLIGQTRAADDERWKITPTQDIPAGTYTLRIDLLGEVTTPKESLEERSQKEKVIARISLPFRRESRAEMAARARTPDQVLIQPGDNLWTIARNFYGRGVLYTIIYENNRNQIRDPDLIYPGQVFSTPNPKR